MEIEDTNLAASKQETKMSKPIRSDKGKKREKKVELKVEVPESYLKSLETTIAEQKLRVLLYQQVISKASEELGVDILKKVGNQWSGP